MHSETLVNGREGNESFLWKIHDSLVVFNNYICGMNFKMLLIPFIAIAILSAACNKDTKAEDTQEEVNTSDNVVLGDLSYTFDYKSILLEFTSTGCPGCGSWGKPTFYSLAASHSDRVIPIAAHIKYGDPMISGVAEFFASNRTGSRYTPQIWVNDESIMVIEGNGINGSASVAKANDLITNATPTTKVGLGGIIKIDGTKAHTKYGVKLASDYEAGDYYVNSYLLEDGIVAQQASYANNPATHNFVLRQAANGPWGNKITKLANQEFEASWEHTYTEGVKEGQYLVTIIWEKVGNVYKPINAVSVK